MKKFENPMLQVVSISKKDIIVTSEILEMSNTSFSDETKFGAPGQRNLFDEWNEGY